MLVRSRLSNRAKELVGASVPLILFAAFVALSLRLAPGPDGVSELGKRTEVKGFLLVHDGYRNGLHPVLSTRYVKWANYDYFHYRGERFEPVGYGAVVVRPSEDLSHRYLVRETTSNFDSLSTIYIEDLRSNEVLGKAWWTRTKNRFSARGWVGQEAALFVRRILVPRKPLQGVIAVIEYPEAEQVVVEKYDLDAGKPEDVVNCPASFSIAPDKALGQLSFVADEWRFQPQAALKSAFCSDDAVFVFSSTFPNDIFVDILHLSGQYLFGRRVESPIRLTELNERLVGGTSVELDDSTASFVAVFEENGYDSTGQPARVRRELLVRFQRWR